MPSDRDDSEPAPSRVTSLAAWVRRWLVVLLVGAYVAGAAAPSLGVWLRDLGVDAASGADAPVAPVSFSLVMVGVLLLCGALSADVAKLRELPGRPFALLLALACAWVPPLLLVGVWSRVAPNWLPVEDAGAIAIGLAIAGVMPVANSAVAWTQQSSGSLVWALGLVVVSISLCPWVTPWLLGVTGLTLSASDAADASLLVSQFTGAVFVVWVLAPTALGLAVRWAAGSSAVERVKPWLTLLSAAALIALNYVNAASALPTIFADPEPRLLATALAAAVSLPIAGALVAAPAARFARLPRGVRIAWSYALGMKNTGLALGLAGATLGGQPVAVLVILAVTLLQHAVAGVVHAQEARRHRSANRPVPGR